MRPSVLFEIGDHFSEEFLGVVDKTQNLVTTVAKQFSELVRRVVMVNGKPSAGAIKAERVSFSANRATVILIFGLGVILGFCHSVVS